ncbi:hypothetical protein N7478_009016 [Penicillium angulare]|uniref:uncharacterized protein n=1 Tax=Penicillium angulare TaxID=116970 RepID=UPI0025407E4B|nr:uncharacterized protein N7478_009016 [Penicillium angulare]KAJ5273891.1 hypothetical protein N7478_009016 [Penicillium angulare]
MSQAQKGRGSWFASILEAVGGDASRTYEGKSHMLFILWGFRIHNYPDIGLTEMKRHQVSSNQNARSDIARHGSMKKRESGETIRTEPADSEWALA